MIFYAVSPVLYDFVRNTKYCKWIPVFLTAITILLNAGADILVPRFSNIAMVFSMGAFSVYFIKVLMQEDIRCIILEKIGK